MGASLDVFIAANPTIVRRSELGRPPSIVGDLPVAFLDGFDEQIHFDAQTMDRVITASIVIVSQLADNVETLQRHDIAVDLLIDHLNVNSISFVPNSVWSDLTVADEDYPVTSDDGTTRHFFATRLTLVPSLMEGRA